MWSTQEVQDLVEVEDLVEALVREEQTSELVEQVITTLEMDWSLKRVGTHLNGP